MPNQQPNLEEKNIENKPQQINWSTIAGKIIVWGVSIIFLIYHIYKSSLFYLPIGFALIIGLFLLSKLLLKRMRLKLFILNKEKFFWYYFKNFLLSFTIIILIFTFMAGYQLFYCLCIFSARNIFTDECATFTGYIPWYYKEDRSCEKQNEISGGQNETAEQLDDYKEISSLLNSENDPNLLIKIWEQEDNFIVGGIGSTDFKLCDIWIAKKINGGWKIISRHQTSPSCELLDQYQVPISMEPICTTKEGQEVERTEQKTANWSIYRNGDYGLEFEYPKDWENIVFKAQESNEVYSFTSQNKRITGIWRHEPSGILAFLLKGKKYCLPSVEENYQDILKIIHPNKEIKTIYNVPPELIKFYGRISRAINFPLNGEYISFILSYYDNYEPFLVDINTGLNILGDYGDDIRFHDPYKNIRWSLDNKVLAIASHCGSYGGKGIDGVFVGIFPGESKKLKLNGVFILPQKDCEEDLYNDLYFIDNNTFSFSVLKLEHDPKKGTYYGDKKTKYEYNVKTKELKEIE